MQEIQTETRNTDILTTGDQHHKVMVNVLKIINNVL